MLAPRYATKWMSRRERQEKLGNQPKKFTNVYVENFGEDMDEDRFKELAVKFGKVLSLKVVVGESGRSKGFGFVSYETPEEAQRVGDQCCSVKHQIIAVLCHSSNAPWWKKKWQLKGETIDQLPVALSFTLVTNLLVCEEVNLRLSRFPVM